MDSSIQFVLRYIKENNLKRKNNVNGRFLNTFEHDYLSIFMLLFDFETYEPCYVSNEVMKFKNIILLMRYKQAINNNNTIPIYDVKSDKQKILAFIAYYCMEISNLTEYFFKINDIEYNQNITSDEKIDLISHKIDNDYIYNAFCNHTTKKVAKNIISYHNILEGIINGTYVIDMNIIKHKKTNE